MKKIVVASTNPVKISATLLAFQKMFPDETFEIDGVSVSSGVSAQPSSGAEALQGALNRSNNASSLCSEVDFWVGLEGGIEDTEDGMQSVNWVVVKSRSGLYGKGKTGTYFLPPPIAALIREGKELGEADDIVFNRTNSKQENGAIGILTHNVMNRTTFYSDAVVLALIPFRNEELY